MAVAYEAGPTGWAIKRLLDKLGVACDVIAPSLVPVRPGDRVKADRRDAKKLVRLLRAGELTFVMRLARHQLSDPVAQLALETMRAHWR